MRRKKLVMLSVVLWLPATGLALAASLAPAKVVEQFIEAYLHGQFAASRSFTLERVKLSDSLFSNWLFGPGGAGSDPATADLFLSRKFIQAFQYTITGTTPTGDNQVTVSAIRTSPNIAHLYTWALAPKRGASPYELIEAVDTYLTKINYPIEESRMQFVLVREVDSWYISAVFDEKFTQLLQQLQGQTQLSAAVAPQGPPPPPAAGGTPGTPPAATSTSSDIGRQLSDAQFNATLQGFNRAAQGLPPASGAGNSTPSGGSTPPKQDEDEPGIFGKISRAIFGKKKNDANKNLPPSMTSLLDNVRYAMQRFASANNSVPDPSQLYDWKSLRRIVNQYGKASLPSTEEEAGFSFVKYQPGINRESYSLVVDLRESPEGAQRVEIADVTTTVRSTPRN
jgi:hypothetical protein